MGCLMASIRGGMGERLIRQVALSPFPVSFFGIFTVMPKPILSVFASEGTLAR